MKPQLLAVVIFASTATQQANGALAFSTGTGSAVTSVDRSATFDTVMQADDLSNYSESQLGITTDGKADLETDPFAGASSGGFYCVGFNKSWVTIKATDGRAMIGVEFLYGNVWTTTSFTASAGDANATIEWQAYLGATLVSSGSTYPDPTQVGIVIGFRDVAGFDSLRVRAIMLPPIIDEDDQSIALEDLKVELAPIPEPSTWVAGAMLALPFAVQGLRHLRNRKQVS